jgi:formylmethanofuran dehydrogenase subunit E
MRAFDDLLKESVETHGHLCPGQVLGVRMAMLGCRLVGIQEPRSPAHRKRLVVFVEIDRCATDAIQSVTGCSMGRRTLKFRDYGIMAATFCNLDTGEAYRVVAREEARLAARDRAPHAIDAFHQQLTAYGTMPDEELFCAEKVRVDLAPWEMPGPPQRHAQCSRCGQVVRDGREVRCGEELLCVPCSGEAYFRPCGEDELVQGVLR